MLKRSTSVGVAVAVGVGVDDGPAVCVADAVGVAVPVADAVGVAVPVAVAVGSGDDEGRMAGATSRGGEGEARIGAVDDGGVGEDAGTGWVIGCAATRIAGAVVVELDVGVAEGRAGVLDALGVGLLATVAGCGVDVGTRAIR